MGMMGFGNLGYKNKKKREGRGRLVVSQKDLICSMDESSDAYLPGAASLIEHLDKTLMLILRDGRHLVGKLRSFDQYLNLILEDTRERIILPGKYCDVELGLYIVRGDTIVLLGEVDVEKEKNLNMIKIKPEELDLIDSDNDKIVWDFDS
jgi:U6 snRNA-associated Sm-like protein LSm1